MEDQELERIMEDPELDQKQMNQDRFTSFMFGPRGGHHHKEHPQNPPQSQHTIDYEELMVNIDTLMESLQGFKPLFKKVFPFIEQIWKKK